MPAQFRETTVEAVRVTRIKLGMDPGSVVNPKELRLPLSAQPYASIDGARWSSVDLMEKRNRRINYLKNKSKGGRPKASVN